MDLYNKIRLFERLDHLIRTKSTGSPKDLSRRLSMSERQIYNIINEMRNLGAPITYCELAHSYRYESDVVFRFGFLVKSENDLSGVKGGNYRFYAPDSVRQQGTLKFIFSVLW